MDEDESEDDMGGMPGNLLHEEEAIAEAKNEISNSRANKIMLSSEHFDFNTNPTNTTDLVNLFGKDRVTVVMFLRNQIDYSRSLHAEHIKWGGINSYEELG